MGAMTQITSPLRDIKEAIQPVALISHETSLFYNPVTDLGEVTDDFFDTIWTQ